MIPQAPIRAVVFDLDGTLVDSLPDIANAVNALLAEHGLAPHGRDAVRTMIGHGVRTLVVRAHAARGVTLSEAEIEARTARYMALYEPRARDETRLFAGVAEVVSRLSERGIPLAVSTNKPTAVSREIVAGFGLGAAIPTVLGGDWRDLPRKPAPDMLLEAARLMGVPPAACAMVGDSETDVAAARAAGMSVAVVGYGYTATAAEDLGADAVAADFPAVGDLLEAWIGRM